MEEQNMRFGWLKNIGRVILILGIISLIVAVFLFVIGIKEKNDLVTAYGTIFIQWGIIAVICGGMLECLAFIEDNTHRAVILLAKQYNKDKQIPAEPNAQTSSATSV